MAKKNKKIEINRNRYNQIRKMDHHSMELCINEYYEQGYDTCKEDMERMINSALKSLQGVKGIGPAKLEIFRQALDNAREGESRWEDDREKKKINVHTGIAINN